MDDVSPSPRQVWVADGLSATLCIRYSAAMVLKHIPRYNNMCPTHLAAVVMRIASKRRFSLANLRPEFTTARRLTLSEIRISYRLVFYIPPPIALSLPPPLSFPLCISHRFPLRHLKTRSTVFRYLGRIGVPIRLAARAESKSRRTVKRWTRDWFRCVIYVDSGRPRLQYLLYP